MYVYVSTSGNDATAVPNNITKPYLTIEAALAVAVTEADSTVFIDPGHYEINSIAIKGVESLATRPSEILNSFGYGYTKHIAILGDSIHSTFIDIKQPIVLEGVYIVFNNVSVTAHNNDLIRAKNSFIDITESYITISCDKNGPSTATILNCVESGIRLYDTLLNFLFYPDTATNMIYVSNTRNTLMFYTRFFNTIFDNKEPLKESLITLFKGEGKAYLTYSTMWVAINGNKYKDLLYFDVSKQTNVKCTYSDIILYSYYGMPNPITSSFKFIKGDGKLTLSNFSITGAENFKSIDFSAPPDSVMQLINTDADVYPKNALYTSKGNGIGTTSFSSNVRVMRDKQNKLQDKDSIIIFAGDQRGILSIGKTSNGRHIIVTNDSNHTLVINTENTMIKEKSYYKLRPGKTVNLVYVSELNKWYYNC